MLLMLEVIMIVSSAILDRSLMTMYTICRRATYTEAVSLLVLFSWTGVGVITSLCWNNLVIPKNKLVASRVLHTSPLSNRPVFPRVSSCQAMSSTFYLCENDATFFRLNWRCIERACILENLCFIEVEQSTAILVLFVEIHLSLQESTESPTRIGYRWNQTSGEKRTLLGTTTMARKIPKRGTGSSDFEPISNQPGSDDLAFQDWKPPPGRELALRVPW
jgi:hypothetical protein